MVKFSKMGELENFRFLSHFFLLLYHLFFLTFTKEKYIKNQRLWNLTEKEEKRKGKILKTLSVNNLKKKIKNKIKKRRQNTRKKNLKTHNNLTTKVPTGTLEMRERERKRETKRFDEVEKTFLLP